MKATTWTPTISMPNLGSQGAGPRKSRTELESWRKARRRDVSGKTLDGAWPPNLRLRPSQPQDDHDAAHPSHRGLRSRSITDLSDETGSRVPGISRRTGQSSLLDVKYATWTYDPATGQWELLGEAPIGVDTLVSTRDGVMGVNINWPAGSTMPAICLPGVHHNRRRTRQSIFWMWVTNAGRGSAKASLHRRTCTK